MKYLLVALVAAGLMGGMVSAKKKAELLIIRIEQLSLL